MKYFLDDETGLMVIYGNGYMQNSYYSSTKPQTTAPWVNKRNEITNVIVEYGVKNISYAAFHYWTTDDDWGYTKITNVKIGKTVEMIGIKAFEHSASIKRSRNAVLKSQSHSSICVRLNPVFEAKKWPRLGFNLFVFYPIIR